MTEPVVLITGAASDVGTAVARRFHASGRKVVLVDRELELSEHIAEELGTGATAAEVDVTDASSWRSAISEGFHVEVLVNAADQMSFTPMLPSTRLEPSIASQMPGTDLWAAWQSMLTTNLSGPMLGMAVVLPGMARRGSGAVVNLVSIDAMRGVPGWSGYCAVDHGMIGLTKAVALEVAPFGVRVNAVCANRTKGKKLRLAQNADAAFDRAVPLGRRAEAEEVATVVEFLATGATYCVGAVLAVDGGRLAGPAPSAVSGLLTNS